MILAYARVSTDQQNLNRQLDALEAYGYDELYMEKITGTKLARPELDKLRIRARAGDSILVESFSRLGRNTRDLLNLIYQFSDSGIELISLKEQLDTTTPTGRLMLTMMLALAQFERDTTVERIKEGMSAARRRGLSPGRPPKDKKSIDRAVKLYNEGTVSVKDIAKICGVSVPTLYRYIEKQKEKQGV